MNTTTDYGVLRVPRSRGAMSGVLLVLLGAWGALIAFIGPYFDYSYRSDATWDWTSQRGWLEVLPGVVTMVGGLVLLRSGSRIGASLGDLNHASGNRLHDSATATSPAFPLRRRRV